MPAASIVTPPPGALSDLDRLDSLCLAWAAPCCRERTAEAAGTRKAVAKPFSFRL